MAVDFKHGKEWREALRRRYVEPTSSEGEGADSRRKCEASPMLRSLMRLFTLYWAYEAAFFIGITAAVTWTTPCVPPSPRLHVR